MTSFELLICATLIALSAYMSASEIALFSLSRFQLRHLKENFRPVHRQIKKLLADPSGVLISILIINEVINISISALITNAIAKKPPIVPFSLTKIPAWAFETVVGILITTPLIMFLCEITPKVIAIRANQLIASLTAGPLTAVYDLFKPIRYFVNFIINLISKKFQPKRSLNQKAINTSEEDSILKESDFLLMVEEGHKEGAIQESELELIRNVFELDNTTVSNIATPLSKVLSIPVHMTLSEALIAIRSQKYSRVPVIGANRKEVVGVLYAKDLLRSKLHPDVFSASVATLMRKPFFVNSGMRLNALFRKFKQQKIHMAIVRNLQGEVVGVVTMSDLLDALFEDLFLEEEPTENHLRPSGVLPAYSPRKTDRGKRS